MKLSDLAKELNITTESIKHFIQDFELELADCIFPNFEVKKDFESFAREHAEFLLKYEKDLLKEKSPEDIANKIKQPIEKVEEVISLNLPSVYDNGYYKSSISSFGVDNLLGGNYNFVYDYFGKKTALTKKDFIGYRDLYFYIMDVLEPFVNPTEARNWGIQKPAGIILYGPPGSGKIFWAKKIADIIGYAFTEVKRHYLGYSYNDGSQTSFNDFLVSMMKKENVLLFIEEFDRIMADHEDQPLNLNIDTNEIIMHYINRFEKENLVMVGAANSLAEIDEEVVAPGRFDVVIPVFPPNAKERAEVILYSMTKDLEKDSLLYKILVKNNADHLPFWNEVAKKMKTFSNTMVIDFTQSLKKKIRSEFRKSQNENLVIDTAILDSALRESASKLTEEYLGQVQQFIIDVSLNNYDEFASRLIMLQQELNSFKVKEEPRRAIGFHKEDESPK